MRLREMFCLKPLDPHEGEREQLGQAGYKVLKISYEFTQGTTRGSEKYAQTYGFGRKSRPKNKRNKKVNFIHQNYFS